MDVYHTKADHENIVASAIHVIFVLNGDSCNVFKKRFFFYVTLFQEQICVPTFELIDTNIDIGNSACIWHIVYESNCLDGR